MLSPKQAAQPNPSYPDLCRQDTTSPWSTDYGGNIYRQQHNTTTTQQQQHNNNTTQHNTTQQQHNTTRHDTTRHDTTRHDTTRHDTTRHNNNNNNNNNNTIWRGSVLTGEERPPHSGELKHALTQAGGPTQSQLSRPMSSGYHISMEHRLRRKRLNSDTDAINKNIVERNTREDTFSLEKKKKENEKH